MAIAAKKAPFPKSNSSRFRPPKPASPLPTPSTEEHSFWNTPGPMERTMNFRGSLLLDESVSLGDISTSSFGTPLPARGALDFDDSPITQPQFTTKDEDSEDGQDTAPPSPLDGEAPAESAKADEDTAPPSPPGRGHIPIPKGDPEPQTPSHRVKMQITMETEAVVVSTQHQPVTMGRLTLCAKAKIWATIGDLIQPGYQHPGEGKTLRAKETMYAPLSRNLHHRH